MDGKMMLGINVGVILALTLFTGIVVLPLKMLLGTPHEAQQNVSTGNDGKQIKQVIEYRKLKLCPGDYENFMISAYISNFDLNCTYVRNPKNDTLKELGKPSPANLSSGGLRVIRPKSAPVTDHILAMLLIASVIVAFVELLQLRFLNPKDTRSDGVTSRRQSIVDLMLPRRCASREPVKPQMSLDMPRIHRSPLRMLATSQAGCVPPLKRRSSFPTYFTLDGTVSDSPTPPQSRTPRRPSVTVDGETGVNTSVLHRRARLIRR